MYDIDFTGHPNIADGVLLEIKEPKPKANVDMMHLSVTRSLEILAIDYTTFW